jgi:transcriptional regulator with XRE-family HTH domain
LTTDKAQTQILRDARTSEKRTVKELNNTGKRLCWIREKLNLTLREVSEGAGIPASSLHGRETGRRPELVEEFLVLAIFFNKLWMKKFTDGCPFFEGKEIKKISVEWIIFGHSDLEANAEIIAQEYQISIKEIEEQFFHKEKELLRQLDLFAKDEN